ACGNSVCEFDPICFALQVNLELQPGESRTINAIAGPLKDNDEIAALRGKYFADGAVEEEFRTVREYFDHATDGVDIHTPDETLNVFVNHWLKHQLLFNATWARVYFNGVRDLLQDADNISIFGADHARATLRKVLSHQYESGYAPRAWIEGQLVEQDYSDSPVWITFTVASLVKETGDLTLLNEEVPFWEGESAEVYEHCRRSLEYLWADRGEHGLSKIHSGDWNDIMNGVGADGDGQSVWLSMALHRALLQFAELAEMIGRSDDADDALTRARQLAEAINTDGWDGEYYLRAFTDDGKPIGTSIENQCFLNPQAWSVISGTAAEERARKAMQAVDEKLERDIGILTVAEPFTEFRKDVGFISATRPGTNVNGGVYVHASTFKMIADCMLDRTEEAYRTLQKILPFSEARDQQTGEPYVVPNAYFAPPSGERYGEAGDGWFTGSAGWLLKGIVAHIFGLQPEADGLHIRPCMPKQWQTSSITRVFRGATYHVTYSPARSADEPAITVDNEPLQSEVLPCEKGQNYRVHVAL
ncbi:MAG: GH36-type glycosyl hydrolase domain-containing protein, partial [Phycisphaerae bacterium]